MLGRHPPGLLYIQMALAEQLAAKKCFLCSLPLFPLVSCTITGLGQTDICERKEAVLWQSKDWSTIFWKEEGSQNDSIRAFSSWNVFYVIFAHLSPCEPDIFGGRGTWWIVSPCFCLCVWEGVRGERESPFPEGRLSFSKGRPTLFGKEGPESPAFKFFFLTQKFSEVQHPSFALPEPLCDTHKCKEAVSFVFWTFLTSLHM